MSVSTTWHARYYKSTALTVGVVVSKNHKKSGHDVYCDAIWRISRDRIFDMSCYLGRKDMMMGQRYGNERGRQETDMLKVCDIDSSGIVQNKICFVNMAITER